MSEAGPLWFVPPGWKDKLSRAAEQVDIDSGDILDEAVASSGLDPAEPFKLKFGPEVHVQAPPAKVKEKPPVADGVDKDLMNAKLGELRGEFKTDLARVEGAVKESIANQVGSLKAEFIKELGALRTDVSKQIGDMKTDFANQVGTVKTDVATQTGAVKTELAKQIGDVKTELGKEVEKVRGDVKAVAVELRVYAAIITILIVAAMTPVGKVIFGGGQPAASTQPAVAASEAVNHPARVPKHAK